MNRYDQSWREINFRDRVVIIRIKPWMEGVALACGFLMVQGFLTLIGG